MKNTTAGERSRPALVGFVFFAAPALMSAVIVVAAVALTGCSKSPVERVIDESIAHLEAAEKLMQDAAGSQDKLLVAVMAYRRDHAGEFRKLRLQGERLFRELDDKERQRMGNEAAARAQVIVGRIERLSKGFLDPKLALRLVRPLTVAASAKPPKPGTVGLLPPKIPGLPGAPTPGTGHAGHGHAGHVH